MAISAIPYSVARASLCNQAKREKPLPFEALRELAGDFILYGIQGEVWDGPRRACAGANNFRAIRSVVFIERNKGKAFGVIHWELKELEDGDDEDSFTLFYCSGGGTEMGRLKIMSLERKSAAPSPAPGCEREAPP